MPLADITLKELQDQKYYNTPHGFLGHSDRIYGSQAGGENPFAQLWMVYARADKRWAGVDLVSALPCDVLRTVTPMTEC